MKISEDGYPHFTDDEDICPAKSFPNRISRSLRVVVCSTPVPQGVHGRWFCIKVIDIGYYHFITYIDYINLFHHLFVYILHIYVGDFSLLFEIMKAMNHNDRFFMQAPRRIENR